MAESEDPVDRMHTVHTLDLSLIQLIQNPPVAPRPLTIRTIAVKESQGFIKSGVVNAIDADSMFTAIIPEGRDSAHTIGRSDVVFSKTHQSKDYLI